MDLMPVSSALNRKFVGADNIINHADSTEKSSTESVSYHAFRIGDIGFLISHDAISEVAEDLPYCQLPNTSSVLYGMANLRGKIIPIFDLHDLFGFDLDDQGSRKILILDHGNDAVAVMTSELPVRITISEQQKLRNLPPIPEILRPYTNTSYQKEGIWLNINNEFYSSLNQYL